MGRTPPPVTPICACDRCDGIGQSVTTSNFHFGHFGDGKAYTTNHLRAASPATAFALTRDCPCQPPTEFDDPSGRMSVYELWRQPGDKRRN